MQLVLNATATAGRLERTFMYVPQGPEVTLYLKFDTLMFPGLVLRVAKEDFCPTRYSCMLLWVQYALNHLISRELPGLYPGFHFPALTERSVYSLFVIRSKPYSLIFISSLLHEYILTYCHHWPRDIWNSLPNVTLFLQEVALLLDRLLRRSELTSVEAANMSYPPNNTVFSCVNSNQKQFPCHLSVLGLDSIAPCW